ncbi:MAG: flippase [Lachnospiraceae bacterium]|nr:flippase [Lachnospiraceae bacterium]
MRETDQYLKTDQEAEKAPGGKAEQTAAAVPTKSLGLNAALNFIKVACSILFPLITFPYITRVLQVENIGKIDYGNSIVAYFALFAALGIRNYGVREGAKKKRGPEFDRFASEAFTLNLLTTALSYAVLFALLFTVPRFRDYRAVILIQSATILLTTLGIEWVNTVYEDFLYITVRSIALQVLCMGAMFLFIRRPEDYLKYACISVLSSGLTCIANWVYCRRYTKIRLLFDRAVFQHLYPMFIFFANSLAITIYVSADTTMLGWIAGDYYTGLYAVAVRIYQIVKQLMTAVYTVTIPRLSRFAGRNDRGNYRKLMTDITSCILLLIVPAMTGLAVYARHILLILSGESYLPAVTSLRILAAALLFSVGSGIVVNCINTPHGFEKTSLAATIAAAVVNVALNVVMIPALRQDGAAITTLIAEALVMTICLVRLRKVDNYVDVRVIASQAVYALGGALLICAVSAVTGRLGLAPAAELLAGLILCPLLYAILLAACRNPYLGQITARFRRR